MLVDVMTAIIGPFVFCTGKPMQDKQMLNYCHFSRIKFFQWQAKSSLAIIGPVESN